MHVVLLGPPGSGKDTLANQILHNYDYIIISPGQLLREESANQTSLGIAAKEYWAKGNLCPDDLINKMIAKRTQSLEHNYLFNGFPRTLKQAKFLESVVDNITVVELLLSQEIAIKRLLKRSREDDSIETIKQRFKQYEKETKSLSSYYKNNNNIRYISLNANSKPKKVYEEFKNLYG